MLMVAINFNSILFLFFLLFYFIFSNICAQQKTESHTGLERVHDDIIFGGTISLIPPSMLEIKNTIHSPWAYNYKKNKLVNFLQFSKWK